MPSMCCTFSLEDYGVTIQPGEPVQLPASDAPEKKKRAAPKQEAAPAPAPAPSTGE